MLKNEVYIQYCMFQCLTNFLGEFSILTVVGFDGVCISKNEDSHISSIFGLVFLR